MEYAVLISALALMLTGPGGAVGDLPQTIAKANAGIGSAAGRLGVPAAEARRAAAAAPARYRKPALRYLYGLGWIAARKDRLTCALLRLSDAGLRSTVRRQFRRTKGMAAALRRAKVTETVAVDAFATGFRAGCGL